jgi:F-type H+-transporting ATPase subunit a
VGKLLSNPKMLAAAIVALAILLIAFLGGAIGAGLGLGFLGSPIPLVQLPAEKITDIGGYQLMNTYVMFWLAGIVLMVPAWLATRKISEIPGRMQSIFEMLFEFFIGLAEASAGGKRGRMFLPIVTGIFLTVLFSNWLGTLPGVGNIGRVELMEEFLHHKIEKSLKGMDGGKEVIELIEHDGLKAFGDEHYLEDHAHETEVFGKALEQVLHEHGGDKMVVFTGNSGLATIPFGAGEQKKVLISQLVDIPAEGHIDVHEIAHIVHQIEHPELLESAHHEEITAEDVENGRVGLLVPFLRGASTDLNTTLAIALVAMISVQFWGFRSLGFKGYAGKFFFNPIKKPIDAFVGLLELVGEGIKVISFTFRLFGNMFAGEILLIAMGFLLPLIGIIPFLGLELFVGVIQAIIFSVLTLIFGSLAILSHEHHDDEHPAEHGEAHH